MTVRSTSAPQPPERPTISFVFPAHDPEYGGGLLARTQRHLDTLIELANRYRLASEIIIVEWNPRQDRAPFRESLRWPDDLGHVCLRFIEVPGDIHRRLPNSELIPIFEYIAKNVGLRRARGQFLLATNPDLFYSPALIRWLARAALSPERFYRVDRRDLAEDIPAGLSLARQLRFCSRHVAHVHALFGSYRPGEGDVRQQLEQEYYRRLHAPASAKRWTNPPEAQLMFPADGLHRNAAGDFLLMERRWWHRLRGYPELHTHAHIDAILCWVAASAGLVQDILPSRCHLYHQAHDRASRAGFPQTEWKPWFNRYQETVRQGRSDKAPSMVVNVPDWGLANEVLPEWHARPQLVQVQALTGDVDEETTQSGRSLDAAENAPGISSQALPQVQGALALLRSDLRRTQDALEAAAPAQAALRATLHEEQSARQAERAAAEDVLRKAQRAHKAERTALKSALHEAQAAQRAEAALRHTLESSTAWRLTWPIRRAVSFLPGFRHALRRSRRLHSVERGVSEGGELGLAADAKRDRPHKAGPPPDKAPKAAHRAPPVDAPAPTTTNDGPPTLAQLLSKRFRELEPLRVFNVPGDAPRVSIVTDSIGASALFGGVSIALVVSALLARHLGARLRVITLTEPPEPGNVAAVFATHRIDWTGDIEFVHVGSGRREEVPVGAHELFLTTSWWSTRAVLPIVHPGRLVYLVQEDERVSYAWGDDRLRCVETLSNPGVRLVVNGRRLFDHLTLGPDALPNFAANGDWFEPAFPAPDRTPAAMDPAGGKRLFLFHARPDHPGNLYWRGLEAIGAALEENVLDPAEWTFHVAGRDVAPIELPRGVRPHIVQNLSWAAHVELVRRMDVGLCLMDAPYASSPPLDLAATRAVLVTNQHAGPSMFASDSNLIICADSSIEGLKRGIAEAAAHTADRDRRHADADRDHRNPDWEAALAPVLARLYPHRTLD